MKNWDEETDFLVVGSGAGAMTAALTAHDLGASTLIIEKSSHYGGASAMSGGTIWVPANQHMLAAGIDDSPEQGFEYLKQVVKGVCDKRLRAYVDKIPEMVKYLHEHSDLQFTSLLKYPDYYPDQPGAQLGGRSIEPEPFNGLLLGDEFDNMRPPHPQILVFGRLTLTAVEAHTVSSGSLRGVLLMLGVMLRYFLNIPARLKHKRSTRLALGNGLIGRLRYSLLKRKVPVWLDTAAEELLVEDGQVVGAVVNRQGKVIRIRANKGVLMACGGFERNQQLRDLYQRRPVSTSWTAAHGHNAGDAVRMGEAVGAQLGQMDDAWWNTTTVVPGEESAYLLVMEKNRPGSIMVDSAGKRFTNEGAPYVNVVNAMYANHSEQQSSIPAYLVFDAEYRKKYPCGPLLPGKIKPDEKLPDVLKDQYLKKSDTLAELEQQLKIPAGQLAATVERFNGFAREGVDRDFGRGESAFDLYYGDETVKPNPTLGELKQPPFYAIEVSPGDVGTKGGLETDEFARVLNAEGIPIPGLFATGNCAASAMGSVCPGAGATIGPAMVFGYIAAQCATAVSPEDIEPAHKLKTPKPGQKKF
jgi:3-oxosteroid 1-dehydrogenase